MTGSELAERGRAEPGLGSIPLVVMGPAGDSGVRLMKPVRRAHLIRLIESLFHEAGKNQEPHGL